MSPSSKRARPIRRTRERSHPLERSDALDDALRSQGRVCVCGNLRMAARLVTAHYDAALRPSGIEANQMIMLWVAHAEDAKPANHLAQAAGMDQSTASRNLAVLAARGLVTFEPSPADGRQRLVRLTRRGKATLLRAYPRWEKAQADLARMTSDLTNVEDVGRLLRKVARRLQSG